MKTSENGIALIKQYEGFSELPYNDGAGFITIGYGHRIKPGEDFTRITPLEAERLLKKDIEIAEQAISRTVFAPLSQGQFDALVSFIYNVGEHTFKYSTLCRVLNWCKYARAADEFGRWVYAGGRKLPGLIRRREAEKRLFLDR